MKKLRALIVEDEKISRELLQNYLNKYCPEVEVVGMGEDVHQGLALIRNTTFDILFLDIEMPYGNAFDILDNKGDKYFETIFVTAYEKYAREALNKQAAYYLLKPISIDELISAVDYVAKKLRTGNVIEKLDSTATKIGIPNLNGFEMVSFEEIIYCTAQDNYTEFVLKDKKVLSSKPLKHYEALLAPHDFMRVHRSSMINMHHVDQFFKGKGGYVIMSNGDKIDISPKKKSGFLDWF